MTTPPSSPEWRWCRFSEHTLRELQYIYMARQQVFCVEQRCAYLDVDGLDEDSHHLTAWSTTQALPLAYARVVAPGARYTEPSIGRVLTTAAARGTGLGRELLRRAVSRVAEVYPGQSIRISAQSHLEMFYQGFGFVATGERYLEDGIPHSVMLRAAA